MSIFNPVNLPVISKLTVGDKVYYLKDAEVRALLATLGDAAQKNVAAGVAADEAGLVTGAQVHAAIAAVSSALQFVGKYDSLEAASASGKEFKDGDIILVGVKEYIRFEGAWIELGDEGIYALKSVTIGTQTLANNIDLAVLKTDLGLGALAYKASAEGTVAGETISGVKATGVSTGEIAVALDQTSTAATLTKSDYTPEGTITGKNTAAGAVSIAKSEDGVQISGSVSAPNVTVTPATASVQYIDSVGTQATYQEGAFHAGSLPTYQQGAKAAWSASVDDNETLSFSFTANGDDTFSQGTLPSKDADQFTANELPTKTVAATVVTGITEAKADAPTFTGDKFAATFTGSETEISANFAGTTAAGAIVTGVNYDKASVNAEGTKFTGQNIELAVGDIVVASKGVTVQ